MGNACAASRRRLLNNDSNNNNNQSDTNQNHDGHSNGNGHGNDHNGNGSNGNEEAIWLAHQSLTSMPTDIPSTVTSLIMDFNHLKELNGNVLAKCTRLTELSVAANQLDLLPVELWRMRSLTSLNIGGNIVRHIPSDIRGLHTLRSLQAQANLLKQLPLALERLPLQQLNVAQNSIIHLPNDTAMLPFPTSLVSLNLASNHLATGLPLCFPEVVPNVTYLDISDTNISVIPPSFITLVHLQKLYVSCNFLVEFPAGMSACTHLQVLDVSYNYLTHMPYDIIQLACSTTSNMRSIELSGNPLVREAPLMDEKSILFGSFPSVPIPSHLPSDDINADDTIIPTATPTTTTAATSMNGDDTSLMNGHMNGTSDGDGDDASLSHSSSSLSLSSQPPAQVLSPSSSSVVSTPSTAASSMASSANGIFDGSNEADWHRLLSLSTCRVAWSFSIPNHIIDNLYLGDYEAAKNKVALQELGITHVLTVAQYEPLYPQLFRYKCVPVADANSETLAPHFADCNRFIHDAMAKGGAVLVHCRAGVSRSASIVLAYLLSLRSPSGRYAFDSYASALSFLRMQRPRIHPNDAFAAQVRAFRHALPLPPPSPPLAPIVVPSSSLSLSLSSSVLLPQSSPISSSSSSSSLSSTPDASAVPFPTSALVSADDHKLDDEWLDSDAPLPTIIIPQLQLPSHLLAQ